jgi:hypothetical protein
MVILRYLIAISLLLILPFVAHADEPTIQVALDKSSLAPNVTIKGNILIGHDKDQLVDEKTFTLEEKPLAVKLVKQTAVAPDSPLIFSYYTFEMPPQTSGLHSLPSISVKVGSSVIRSPIQSYQVSGNNAAIQATDSSVLKLENIAELTSPMFQGQKGRVGYRLFFNQNFEVYEQNLPLLEMEGFKKVGGEQVADLQSGDYAVRQSIQEIQAVEPGNYTFGPSSIRARAYKYNASGGKNYTTEELKIESPAVNIVVEALPPGKPASFNGAFGENLGFKVELYNYNDVIVGEKLTLKLTVSGEGDLKDIPQPDLCCQPGFPGRFKENDIPGLEEMQGNDKVFIVEMRPLSTSIKEIPSIEFTYLNPKTKKYMSLKSDPIPMRVGGDIKSQIDKEDQKGIPVPDPAPATPLPATPAPKEEKPPSTWPPATDATQPIEIESVYPLTTSDLRNRKFGTWSIFLLIPVGAVALYIQMDQKRRRERILKDIKKRTSDDAFADAVKNKNTISLFTSYLTEAFILRLQEKGIIPKTITSIQELPSEGICQEVKEFLNSIEEQRFSGRGVLDKDKLVSIAETLFKRI